uniref:Uncharacterized protein n=1 Tax=Romanomermis culicivorax TaxID=13658 RepID=A0A915HGS5_ROMCU
MLAADVINEIYRKINATVCCSTIFPSMLIRRHFPTEFRRRPTEFRRKLQLLDTFTTLWDSVAAKRYCKVWFGRAGYKMCSQVWRLIRQPDYPEYMLVGDSMVNNMTILDCVTIALLGTDLMLMEKIVTIVLNLERIGVTLRIGINIMSTLNRMYKANRKKSITDCTKLNTNAI